MGDLVVAADIGGTKTAVGLVSDEGEVLASATRPTPGPDGPSAVLGCVATLVTEVLASVGRGPADVVGLGVGSAGVIDADRGVVLSATDVLRDWAGTDVASAEVWAEDPEGPAARLVASWLGKGVEIRSNEATTAAGVVVVVGDEFKDLAKGRKQVAAEADTTLCSPPATPTDGP